MDCSRCACDYKPIFAIDTIDNFVDVFKKKVRGCTRVKVILVNDRLETKGPELLITSFKRINFSWTLWLSRAKQKHTKYLKLTDLKKELKNQSNWDYLRDKELDVAVNDNDCMGSPAWGGVQGISKQKGTLIIRVSAERDPELEEDTKKLTKRILEKYGSPTKKPPQTFPTYVRFKDGDIVIKLISSKTGKRASYYRAGGRWGLTAQFKDGKLMSLRDTDHKKISNKELVRSTKKAHDKSNGEYV